VTPAQRVFPTRVGVGHAAGAPAQAKAFAASYDAAFGEGGTMAITNLAPDIFRQRLLIEGFFARPVDAAVIRAYLLGLAAHLDLRTYGEPVIFAPALGEGRAENAGFDAFVPLIDSGIAGYFWTGPRFLSVVLYTCKGFDPDRAVAFTRDYFAIEGEIATHAF
jgi:hypothetical protein